jgi:hypothetical protein
VLVWFSIRVLWWIHELETTFILSWLIQRYLWHFFKLNPIWFTNTLKIYKFSFANLIWDTLNTMSLILIVFALVVDARIRLTMILLSLSLIIILSNTVQPKFLSRREISLSLHLEMIFKMIFLSTHTLLLLYESFTFV